MNYAAVKIVLKLDYIRQDKTTNTRLRLTIDRKVKYYLLNVYIRPENFKSGIITKADADHFRKNLLIAQKLNKANNILFNLRLNDASITFSAFERDFINDIYGSKSFYEYVEYQIKIQQGKLASGSLKGYFDQSNKLKSFRDNLSFNEIDKKFIEQYEAHLIKVRKNNTNTIIKSMKFIKSMLNKAISDGILKENVFDKIKLGRTIGSREFLTRDELKNLEELYINNTLKPNKANVLRYFLFCCYTGLRYSDINNLKFNDIKDEKYISISMIKTKEKVNIPLSEKAKLLIPKQSFKMQAVFKVLSDQPTNRYLKEIMREANINKSISFHCSRHTFATVSKSLGMDYDVISKILGHTDIKTTKVYAKYELDFLGQEMEKWN